MTIYLLSIIGVITVIISENRSPVRALPWIIVILFVPVVGILFYLHFGVNVRRIRLISNKTFKRLSCIPRSALLRGNEYSLATSKSFIQLCTLIKKSSNAPITHSSSIEVITSGEEYLNALVDTLGKARHHIHLQGYRLHDDHTGKTICDLLCAKAEEGVEVCILYDKVGSRRNQKIFRKKLRKSGIAVHPFMKVKFPFLAGKVNYRNHRKIVIVDGEAGFIGNMDLEDRFLYTRSPNKTSALQLKLSGDAVYRLQQVFLIDLYISGKHTINTKEYYNNRQEKPMGQNLSSTYPMQIVTSSPTDFWSCMEQYLTQVILNAKEEILIETPVLIPTDQLQQALVSAALSGVRVHLLLPRKMSSLFPKIASRSFFKELNNAGILIYYAPEGYRNVQYLVVDSALSIVGTSRLDFRSFENNFEIDSFIYGESFASQLKGLFWQTQSKSILVDTSLTKKSPIKYLTQRIIRLLTPLI